MTTVSQIITDAFRQSNLIAVGASPTSAQQTEALRYLNRAVKSVFGNEAGDKLTAVPVGSENYSRPSGYPWWNTVPSNDWFVPENIRVMLNVAAPTTLYLHPDPDDGARFAATDVGGNLATYPVTVSGNGRTIEGGLTATLNTDDFSAEWFYRSDTGNWVKYATLAVDDIFPFPEEFDDYFITALAMRLNPAYGTTLDPQAQATYTRAKTQLRARYSQNKPARSELGILRMSKMATDRDAFGNSYEFMDPNAMFEKGWPW